MLSVWVMLAWLFYGIASGLVFLYSLYCFVMWFVEEFFTREHEDPPRDPVVEMRKRQEIQRKMKEWTRVIELKGGYEVISIVNWWKDTRDYEREKALNPDAKWNVFGRKGPMDDYNKWFAQSFIDNMKKNGVWQEERDEIDFPRL